MNDQELDRLLAAALDVEHSPDFVGRVRRRIDAERARRWSTTGRFAVAACLAAVVLAAVLLRPQRRVAPPARAPAPTAGSIPSAASVASAPTRAAMLASVPDARPLSVSRPKRPARPAGRLRTPEVLLSMEERRGLELAVRVARRGLLPSELLSAPPETHVLEPIAISPMNIEPLPEIVPLQGDRP